MNTESLDDSLLAEIEAYSVTIARQAGRILVEKLRKPLDVHFKGQGNRDPVTIADHLSDEFLKKAIKEKFPQHIILSEEEKELHDSDSPFVWVLDPLDGTTNFMNGLPLFAVSVGVLWKRQPVAGSIYVSVSHRTGEGVYHARLGHGAFLNNERIAVCTQPSGRPLSQIPFYPGSRFRLSGRSRKEPHETRNLGSMALELTMAASGIFQYALMGRPMLWDVAAGVLLVKEAGGVCFLKRPGIKEWQTLERFQSEGKDPPTLETLRKWSLPLLVGAPEATQRMVKEIQIRRRPLSIFKGRFWPRRKDSAPVASK